MLERGLEEGDLSLLGRAATISSTIMQEYERNEVLDSLLEALWDIRALGINRAHTGRALGVLFDLRIVGLSEAQRRVAEVLEGKEIRLWTARAIGGGVQVVRG
jgi:L-threonine kinase